MDDIESYQIAEEINVVGDRRLFNQITLKSGQKYRVPLSCYFASWDLRRLPLLLGYVTLIDQIMGNLLAPHLDNVCESVEDQNGVVIEERIGYDWRCSACEKPNRANQSHCQQCGCPAVATGVEVAKFQKGSSDGDAIKKSPRKRIGLYLLVVVVALIPLRLYFMQSEYPYYQVVSGKMSRIFMKDEFRTIPTNKDRS